MSIAILNVGEGHDAKITFDKDDPAALVRAARIVKDMLRRGYALLVDVGDGTYQRVHDFDDKKYEYIIADFDPGVAAAEDRREADGEAGKSEKIAADNETGRATAGGGRRRGGGRKALSAKGRNAVAVGRTAGG